MHSCGGNAFCSPECMSVVYVGERERGKVGTQSMDDKYNNNNNFKETTGKYVKYY